MAGQGVYLQDQKGHEDSKQLAQEYLYQQHTHGINDTEMIDCKSNSVLNHQSNKSSYFLFF